jgi:NADH-quinone oxidoreductase subunit L
MTIPLIVLAILAVVGGYVGLPEVFSEHHLLNEYLAPVVSNAVGHHLDHSTEWMLMGLSVTLIVIMIVWAYTATRKPAFKENTGLAKVLENKWYVDELYDTTIVKPMKGLSLMLDRYVERSGIDGIVNGVGKLVNWGSGRLRLLQNGQVGTYIFAMIVGVVILFAIGLFVTR